MIEIKVKKLHPDAIVPTYGSTEAAGFDLYAVENFTIMGQSRGTVPTGIAIEIPIGYEVQVRPRSGLAIKNGLTVLNSPGTVDSDYRGEIKVVLFNSDKSNYSVRKGDRIAQGVLKQVPRASFKEVLELGSTDRGTNGFGSTGS